MSATFFPDNRVCLFLLDFRILPWILHVRHNTQVNIWYIHEQDVLSNNKFQNIEIVMVSLVDKEVEFRDWCVKLLQITHADVLIPMFWLYPRTMDAWWLFPKFFTANIFGLGLKSKDFCGKKQQNDGKFWPKISQIPKMLFGHYAWFADKFGISLNKASSGVCSPWLYQK